MVGSDPIEGIEVYVCASSAFLLSCESSGLVTGQFPVQGVPSKCLKDIYFQSNYESEQVRGPNRQMKRGPMKRNIQYYL